MRLRRSVVSGPGMHRVRRGKGFSYHDQNGKALTDDVTLTRIRDLVIPPAWKNVWISPHANGHIQAVGTDAAGRRQYLYHEQWQEDRAEEKFDRVLEMSKALPDMRRRSHSDLRKRGLERDRVLALALQLLDLGYFRAGGEQYAEENNSFGIATLLCEHVSLQRAGGRVRLSRQERSAPHIADRRPRSGSFGTRAASTAGPHRPVPGVPQLQRTGRTFTPTTSTPGSRSSSATSTPSRICAPGTAPCWPPRPSSTPTHR